MSMLPEVPTGEPREVLRQRWCNDNPALIDALMAGRPTDEMIIAAALALLYPSSYMGGPPELTKREARRMLEAAFKTARPRDQHPNR